MQRVLCWPLSVYELAHEFVTIKRLLHFEATFSFAFHPQQMTFPLYTKCWPQPGCFEIHQAHVLLVVPQPGTTSHLHLYCRWKMQWYASALSIAAVRRFHLSARVRNGIGVANAMRGGVSDAYSTASTVLVKLSISSLMSLNTGGIGAEKHCNLLQYCCHGDGSSSVDELQIHSNYGVLFMSSIYNMISEI